MAGKTRPSLMAKTLANVSSSNLSLTDKKCIGEVFKRFEELNTADVQEVKHGEWELHEDGSGTCKNCNTHQKAVWDMDRWQNFCGRCGAKMNGVKKNDFKE